MLFEALVGDAEGREPRVRSSSQTSVPPVHAYVPAAHTPDTVLKPGEILTFRSVTAPEGLAVIRDLWTRLKAAHAGGAA